MGDTPDVLYHGSPDKDIQEFEPRENPHRDEPPSIYATPLKYLAVMYMHRSTGMTGYFGEIPYAILFGSRDECMRLDHGGHLYTLPIDSFVPNVGKGHGAEREWVSRQPVKPITIEEFPSVIDELLKEGVQVYILDRERYQELHEANTQKELAEILHTAQSENQRRGVGIREF